MKKNKVDFLGTYFMRTGENPHLRPYFLKDVALPPKENEFQYGVFFCINYFADYKRKFEPVNPFIFKVNRCELNLDYGEFHFFIQGNNGSEFEFQILPIKALYGIDINAFWRFLEVLVDTRVPVIFYVCYRFAEYYIYVDPNVGANLVHLMIFDNKAVRERQKRGEVNWYTVFDFDFHINALVDRKSIVREFYTVLRFVFDKYDALAYFEPPIIEFAKWKKDSNIIRKYLGLKQTKKGGEPAPPYKMHIIK